MKWLQQLIEKVCQETQNKKINNYSITIIDDIELFEIRVVDLINDTPPKITKSLFYDQVEDSLIKTINSL